MPKKVTLKLKKPHDDSDWVIQGAQAVAVRELVDMHGGTALFAAHIGEKAYNVANWKKFGVVPLSKVGPLARKLGLSMYIFNYNEVKNLMGSAPSWKDIISGVGFSTPALRKILDA